MTLAGTGEMDSLYYSYQYSRLYCLKPVGVGTPVVESLSSYIARLAEAHSVNVGALITKEVCTNFTQKTFFDGVKKINGFSLVCLEVTQALESLTLRNDLKLLSMYMWQNVFANRGMLRDSLAWCPDCYIEMFLGNKTIYNPLIWHFEAVVLCLRHMKPLISQCPNCGSSVKVLGGCKVGFCTKCNVFLGRVCEDTYNTFSEYDIFATRNIEQLLGETPEKPVLPIYLHSNLSNIIEHMSLAEIPKIINVDVRTLKDWKSGLCLPTLNLLLKFCYSIQSTLKEVLSADVLISEKLKVVPLKGSNKNSALNKIDVENYLRNILENGKVLSRTDLEKALGCNY